jgi:hypothetical protein
VTAASVSATGCADGAGADPVIGTATGAAVSVAIVAAGAAFWRVAK